MPPAVIGEQSHSRGRSQGHGPCWQIQWEFPAKIPALSLRCSNHPEVSVDPAASLESKGVAASSQKEPRAEREEWEGHLKGQEGVSQTCPASAWGLGNA